MNIPRILLTPFILLALTSGLWAEHVFLKDGSIIHGTIIRDRAASITLRDAEGKTRVISRKDIMRILYTELSMGKVQVQLRDGSSFTAYMVDEDRVSYTFRKDLYKPEELTIKRADVLFIAERNPSGLKGKADTDEIELEWYESYAEMKHYNIYVKKKDNEFELADRADDPPYTLEDLTSNTTYQVKVTGVDKDNTETGPSNVLTIKTKNILPGRPPDVLTSEDADGNVRLSWKPSSDPDGEVTAYRVELLVEDNWQTLVQQ